LVFCTLSFILGVRFMAPFQRPDLSQSLSGRSGRVSTPVALSERVCLFLRDLKLTSIDGRPRCIKQNKSRIFQWYDVKMLTQHFEDKIGLQHRVSNRSDLLAPWTTLLRGAGYTLVHFQPVNLCVFVCVCVCVHARACVCVCVSMSVVHKHVRTMCMYVCMHACTHALIYADVSLRYHTIQMDVFLNVCGYYSNKCRLQYLPLLCE